MIQKNNCIVNFPPEREWEFSHWQIVPNANLLWQISYLLLFIAMWKTNLGAIVSESKSETGFYFKILR